MSRERSPDALLLDTCVFLWLIGLPEQLPARVRGQLEKGETGAFVSTATLWEALIKLGKGKLSLDTGGIGALNFLIKQCEQHRLDVLPIVPRTLEPLERLPAVHRDPFDRLLICQAIENGLTLVTPDRHIRQYPIKTLWD